MHRRRSRTFRLATVLRVRKRQEDMRAQALAEIQSGIRKAHHRRDELVELQREKLTDANALSSREFDTADERRYFQIERHLARCAVDTDARLAELNGVASERRAELEAASQKKKVIERLRVRHFEAVVGHDRYWEQRTSDEIASGRAHRARRKGSG